MSNLIGIFLGMALVNNFILARFLGLCPFFGVSKKMSNAISMGLAVLLVMTGASFVTWFVFHYVLDPYNVQFMHIVVFILVVAAFVQIIEMTIRRTNITLYNALGIYLPLITTNCAVLGVTLINMNENYSLAEAMVSALGGGVGFMLVLAMMSNIRERLDLADPPKCFRGIPVAMLVAMLLGLAFLGFGGMV